MPTTIPPHSLSPAGPHAALFMPRIGPGVAHPLFAGNVDHEARDRRDVAPALGARAHATGAAPRLELAADEVHLWCANDEQIGGADLEWAYRGLLSPSERARQTRFRFTRDRHRFLVTRALVRTVLSRYAPVPPQEWRFATNAYGRPRIANTDAACGGMTFNVSHTDGLIVLGIARGMRLGVDAEQVNPRFASLDLAEHCFAPAELSDLRALPGALQPDRFFEYWTLKESYIKARGEGLSIPLEQFGFALPAAGGITLSMDPRQADNASTWRFLQFRPTPRHLVAVCSDAVCVDRTRTTLRNVVPLVCEQVLEHRPTRASAPADLALPGSA